MRQHSRRHLLASTAAVGIVVSVPRPGGARVISGAMPWSPNEAYPPTVAKPGPWMVLTAEEAEVVAAIADRIIPPDELGPGGREAGCAVFIDRQLAGPYGSYEWLYMQPPFVPDAPANMGIQSPVTPVKRYKDGLAALAAYTRQQHGGKLFHQLEPAEQDKLLAGIEKGDVKLPDGRAFFSQVQANVVEGYFADPIYGGNKDMCGWKLVGFPGVRYDYRDVIANPNKPYTLPPVGLAGRGLKEASR